jgi:ABC-type lipoprotein export system ATPase subunit
MKKIQITNHCPDFKSYRAAYVKSLFNSEDAHTFSIEADLPIDSHDWQIGLIVGPSGSGKSTLGQAAWGKQYVHSGFTWPKDAPIIDAISPDDTLDKVTAALATVGLGSVPSWLRPFGVLSTGEKFRAELARIVCDSPAKVVIDEFTSVVDRQVAKVGANAFAKAWRKSKGQVILISCHYDIIDWLTPDWVLDTATGKFSSGGGVQRPTIQLDIFQTDWRFWPLFEPHHYLKLPHMIAATNYVGFVDSTPVAHLAVSTRPGLVEGRACRLVVMPEWQGCGVGLVFLNAVCDMWRRGKNRYKKPLPVLFHTSHPGLAKVLRRDPNWCQVSCVLHGSNKARCIKTMAKSKKKKGAKSGSSSGYGGHFRAVQGFRYLGDGGAA